jgi:hypothetical protein
MLLFHMAPDAFIEGCEFPRAGGAFGKDRSVNLFGRVPTCLANYNRIALLYPL